MKHSYLQFKRSAFLFLIASALFGKVNAQSDSLRSARTDGTQSVNGTVTYDGTGAGTGGSEGSYFGNNAGRVTTGNYNSFFGSNSGYSNTGGMGNVFVGQKAGYNNTTGSLNIFIGLTAGVSNTTGKQNVSLGYASGMLNTSGEFNVFIGNSAGNENSTGKANTYVGAASVNANTIGEKNTSLGAYSGYKNITGTGNIFIGHKAGFYELGSNKLYIANDSTSSPLVYGDFGNKQLVLNGKVGVSTSTFPTTVGGADVSAYKLFVKGGILSDEIRVRTGWADYVFDKNYDLKSLPEVENFIQKNGHLPNVPSANEVDSQGLDLGNIAKIQQEKIEELTLYIIDQNKRLDTHKSLLESQQQEINDLRLLLESLIQKNKK